MGILGIFIPEYERPLPGGSVNSLRVNLIKILRIALGRTGGRYEC
jgi:hypothetical protein